MSMSTYSPLISYAQTVSAMLQFVLGLCLELHFPAAVSIASLHLYNLNLLSCCVIAHKTFSSRSFVKMIFVVLLLENLMLNYKLNKTIFLPSNI